MSVGAWQPEPNSLTTLESSRIEQLLELIASDTDITTELEWITALAHAEKKAWVAAAGTLQDSELEALIRFFTEQEGTQSWTLGEKSPVIPLFKTLKKSAGLNRDLVQWVKAHTDNKYLPFGPLL